MGDDATLDGAPGHSVQAANTRRGAEDEKLNGKQIRSAMNYGQDMALKSAEWCCRRETNGEPERFFRDLGRRS